MRKIFRAFFVYGCVCASSCAPKTAGPPAATDTVAGFVDSHVHLAYFPVAEQLAANGVAAAVDLAAPIESLKATLPVEMVWAGPMVTGVRGYPTQSWGRNGYGIECASREDALAAVDTLHAAGARVVKIPAGELTDDAFRAAVQRAHEKGMKVASHALTDAAASKAADLGADVLAHTPRQTLSDATVAKWKDRAVISTLRTFGGVDNLRRLKAAGATILYGTDLGNVRTVGLDPGEIQLLADAGLTPSEILASMTTVPEMFWGLPQTKVKVVVDARWKQDPRLLAKPIEVLR